MTIDETSLPFLAGTQAGVRSALQHLKLLLCDKLSLSDVSVLDWEELKGGSIQKNWRLDLKGVRCDKALDLKVLLRQESKSKIPNSLKKEREFNVLSFLHQKGLQVPEPYFYQEKTVGLPRDILVMAYHEGTSNSDKILDFSAAERLFLAQDLMAQLAYLHALDLHGLGPQNGLHEGGGQGLRSFINHFFAQSRASLEHLGASPLVLTAVEDWAARQDDRVLGPEKRCLLHGDFRTGNYLSSSDGTLQAVLDWEFAEMGPAVFDLGWFTGPMWCYGRSSSPAGGLCDYESLLQAYHTAGGEQLSLETLKFWQILAMVKWLVIAHQQGDRFFTQGDHDPELALTGLVRPVEVEQWLLMAIMPDEQPRSFDPEFGTSNPIKDLLLTFWTSKIRRCKTKLAMQHTKTPAYQRLALIVEGFGLLSQDNPSMEKAETNDLGKLWDLNELWQANGWSLQLFSPEAIGGAYCELATGKAISATGQS